MFGLQTDGNAVMYVNGGAVWAAGGDNFPNGLDTTNVGSPPHRFWIMDNGDFQIHRYDSSTGAWSTKWKYSDNDASNFAKSGYPTTLGADGELCHPNYDKPSGSGSSCRPQWCVSCPMGLIAVNMSACAPCPLGTYLGNGSTACTQCAAGKFGKAVTGQDAADDCANCDAGKFSSTAGSTVCSTCGPGTYALAAASMCTECAAGKYGKAVMSATDLLLLRPPGCTPCHENAWAPTGSGNRSMCLCNAGYTGPDGGNCQACLAGTFKPTNGSQACVLCEIGKYSTLTAGSSCFQCPSNASSVAGSGNISDCKCNAGWFGEDGGSCATCEPGKFKAVRPKPVLPAKTAWLAMRASTKMQQAQPRV